MHRVVRSPLVVLLLMGWASPALAAAPVAVAGSASVAEDGVSLYALRASDPDRDAITYEIVTQPAHGTVSLSGRNAQYTPTANYYGADSYTFRARDTGGSTSNVATVSYTVTAVNDAPTAAAGSLTISENGSGSLVLGGSDVEGGALTYSLATAPLNGSVSITASTGLAVFTPSANWSGSTSFRYQVSDGSLASSATVSVTVLPVNNPPVAVASTGTVNEDASGLFNVLATDADNDSLTYTISRAPAHGTATISGRTITYTPTANYNGADSLTFVASDGVSSSAAGTLSLTVNPVNDPPTTFGTTASTNEDVAVSISLGGADIDGNPLTWVIDSAANGTATVNATTGVATFTPAANVTGAGQFTFHVNDGTVSSLAAPVTVTIVPVDDTPTAGAVSVTLAESAAQTTITLLGTDPDSSSLTYTLASMAAHGSVTLLGRSALYTPVPGYSGVDSFTYTVSDGAHTSTPGTVSITLTPVNDPPVARNTAAMSDGSAIVIVPMASDAEGAVSTPSIVTPPVHGTVRMSSGQFRYTPDRGYIGRDRFTWQVSDGTSTSTAEVQVSVVPGWGGAGSGLSQVGVNNIHFYSNAVGTDPAAVENQPQYILDELGDLGIETVRQLSHADVMWAGLEPTDGNYFYANTDSVLALTELEPRYTLFSAQYSSPTPPWATSPAEFQKELGTEAYDYLDHALTRYADDVRYWEIGNEMFHWVAADPPVTGVTTLPTSYPLDGYSPEEQADFLAATAAYIRAQDPDAIIVLPAVIAANASTDDWLQRVVARTGSDWFDVVTYHSYAEWQVARADRPHLGVEMSALDLDDKLVQLTETGSSSDLLNTNRTDYPNSPDSQAADVFRRLLPGWAAGDSSCIWHTYREHTDEVEAGMEGTALFEEDFSPKASAYAMMLLNTELLPFVQVTDASVESLGVYAYEVRSADGSVHWAAWGSGTWTVPTGMTQKTSVIADASGTHTWQATSAGSSITLQDTPVLLR